MVSSPCCASLVAVALAIAPDAPTAIAVDITALGARRPSELRSMVRELSAIWEGHGIAVTWITTPAGRAWPGQVHVLNIVNGRGLSDRPRPAPARPPLSRRLGAVLFLEGQATAENRLVLAVDAIEQFVETAPWANRRVADWPSAVRSELVGRALGRVLAHEMGHYLLAWRAHTAGGLMRAEFNAEALVDPDRSRFTVPWNLLPRLRARLAQLSAIQ